MQKRRNKIIKTMQTMQCNKINKQTKLKQCNNIKQCNKTKRKIIKLGNAIK